jgi:hypothetical protein
MNLTPGGQLSLGKLPLEAQLANGRADHIVSYVSCVIAHT